MSERPRAEGVNSAFAATKWIQPESARQVLDPNDTRRQVHEFADGLDFRGAIGMLNALRDVSDRLKRRASPAYVTDLLDGDEYNINNYEGVCAMLGYEPELGQAIGFLRIHTDTRSAVPVLIAPNLVPERESKPAHWVVKGGGDLHNGAQLRPVFTRSE